MSIEQQGAGGAVARLTLADVQEVTFPRSTMLHPGYSEGEVDRFLERVAQELARLQAQNAELQEQVSDLAQRLQAAESRPGPSDQAVGILAAAQQTADQYVAEAEAFSRVMTSEAREQYEDQLRQAREKAGAIIQAAQEAAHGAVAADVEARPAGTGHPDAEAVQRQVVYLQAFGQACRVQLRSYLEALLADVESEWGRADPSGLPAGAVPAPAPIRVPQPPAHPAVEAPAGAGADQSGHVPNVVRQVAGPSS